MGIMKGMLRAKLAAVGTARNPSRMRWSWALTPMLALRFGVRSTWRACVDFAQAVDELAKEGHLGSRQGARRDEFDTGFAKDFQLFEVVFAQGVAGFDQVDDHICDAQHRAEFDGTVQEDDLGVPAAFFEVICGGTWQFGCDGDGVADFVVLKVGAFGYCDREVTASEREGVGSQDVGGGFIENVGAADTDFGHAVFHVGGHVGVFDDQQFYGSSEGCAGRSEEHTSELQSRGHLVCRLLLEKKKNN